MVIDPPERRVGVAENSVVTERYSHCLQAALGGIRPLEVVEGNQMGAGHDPKKRCALPQEPLEFVVRARPGDCDTDALLERLGHLSLGAVESIRLVGSSIGAVELKQRDGLTQ